MVSGCCLWKSMPAEADVPAYSRVLLKRFIIGIMFVLIVGLWAMLHLRGYDHGLPFVERQDEGRNLAESYIWRGLSQIEPAKPGYPPGILWMYIVGQWTAEAFTGKSALENPGMVLGMVRLFAAGATLLTVFFIGLIARKLAGLLPAFVAMIAWLSLRSASFNMIAGFPQVYETLLVTLAFWLALLSLEKDDDRFALLSVGVALLAVVFKYTQFFSLGLGVGVSVWNLMKRHDMRRWGRTLALQIAAIALTVLALFTLYNPTDLISDDHAEATSFVSGGYLQIVRVDLGIQILESAFNQLELPALLVPVLLIIGTLLIWRKGVEWLRLGWLAGLLLAFSGLWFLTTLDSFNILDRHTAPFAPLLTILVAVSLAYAVQWGTARLNRPRLAPVVFVVTACFWIMPTLIDTWQNANQRSLPSTQAALAQWTIDALDEGALLVSNENNQLFSREWGGYTGPPRALLRRDVETQPLAAWRELDVNYVQLTIYQKARLEAANRPLLDDMLFLKRFPPEGEDRYWRGLEMYVYRLWDMQYEVNIALGGQILLRGYDLSSIQAAPGDTLLIKPYWQAIRQPDSNYNVFLHLVPLDDVIPITQVDTAPTTIYRPTSTWDDPGETYLGTELLLTIPDDRTPGRYRMHLGLYDFNTGTRLLTEDGDDHILLAEVEVR